METNHTYMKHHLQDPQEPIQHFRQLSLRSHSAFGQIKPHSLSCYRNDNFQKPLVALTGFPASIQRLIWLGPEHRSLPRIEPFLHNNKISWNENMWYRIQTPLKKVPSLRFGAFILQSQYLVLHCLGTCAIFEFYLVLYNLCSLTFFVI